MTTIVTRAGKGSPLTFTEADANFTNLNNDKIETSAIGTTVQAYDAQLADIAGLTPTDNGVVIGDGTHFVVESGATLKTSLGLTIGTDVMAHVAPSTSGKVLTSNGSAWTSAVLPTGGAAGDVQTFNAGGTWTKPASGTMALIEVWGTGGGGARQAAGNSAGGGGGGYSFLWKKLSDLGATETVTIGAGGAVQNTDATDGNHGGTTSFGAHITHVGGSGGNRSAAAGGASSPMCGGVGSVQGNSSTTTARSGVNSQCSGSQLTCVPLGSAGINSTSYAATDGAVNTCVPCMMGGGNGGGVSTVLNAQGTGGTSAFGGAGGNGNKAGAGATGTQPGGGGGSGTTQGGAGGDGRVKVSVF